MGIRMSAVLILATGENAGNVSYCDSADEAERDLGMQYSVVAANATVIAKQFKIMR